MKTRAKVTQGERRRLIREIVSQKKIPTQSELAKSLLDYGVKVTQATLSRDIKELGLAKFHENGMNYYAVYNQTQASSDFASIYREFILSIQSVMFMIVCHTRLGEADLLANEFDEAGRSEILGTIAGADTLLVVCASMKDADDLLKEIQDAISNK